MVFQVQTYTEILGNQYRLTSHSTVLNPEAKATYSIKNTKNNKVRTYSITIHETYRCSMDNFVCHYV